MKQDRGKLVENTESYRMKGYCIKRLNMCMAGLLLTVMPVCAQAIPDKAELDAVLNPDMIENATARFSIEPNERSIGTLSEDTVPVSYTFLCRNTGTQPLTVQKLVTSCGCTQAQISKQHLTVGDTATITVRYNPYAQAGRVFSRVFIYTDLSDKRPTGVVTLTGEVTPSADLWKDFRYAMGTLRVRRKSVSFGKVQAGSRRVETIPCVNSGSRPLRISATAGFLPAYLTLRCEPAELEPGQTGELVLELDGDKLPKGDGTFQARHRILLNGISSPPSSRTVVVSIGDVSQVRSTVNLSK